MEKAKDTIDRIRAAMGDSLSILGHHYQSDEVIACTDIRGDSLELARKINELKAEHIVFCGVYFMAESAAILSRPGQKIHIPDPTATCPMADMAEGGRVRKTLDMLQASGRKVIPLTYVNSSAAVKGVVGEYHGSVCTSANAKLMLDWSMSQGDAVLFLPDQHLGNNTADALGIPADQRLTLPDGVMDGDPELLFNPETAEGKKLILWPGYCPIHAEFTLQAVRAIRENEPEAKIVVHPECDPAIVQAVDGNGSTTFLINYPAQAPAAKLATLDTAKPVTVSNAVKEPAKLALERMLAVCS